MIIVVIIGKRKDDGDDQFLNEIAQDFGIGIAVVGVVK